MLKKLFVVVSFAAIIMMLMTACQPQIQTVVVKETVAPVIQTVEVKQTVQVKETVVQQVTPTAVPVKVEKVFGDLPRNETFIVGSNSSNPKFDCFNYLSPATKCDEWNGGLQLSEENLFLNFNNKIVPVLGQKWEYNSDFTQMKLYLATGITFSDGTPVTMDDWLFSLKGAQDNADKGLHWALSKDVTFEAAGDNVILFKMYKTADDKAGIKALTEPNPNPTFHMIFVNAATMGFHLLPKKLWDGKDYVTYPNNPPVGTGPYKLKSLNADTFTAIWELRSDYWNKALLPGPKYIVFTRMGAADAAIDDFIAGKYDIGGLPQALMDRLIKENKSWVEFVGLDICPRHISFNATITPFDDVEFRHAMSLLINRESIAKLDTPPSYPMIVPWPYIGQPDTKWYDPADTKANDIGVYDPKKAGEILDKAGYKMVNGKRVDKAGKPIAFDVFSLDGGSPGAFPRLFAYDAGLLGITANVKMPGDANVFFDAVMKGNYGMALTWLCAPASYPVDDYGLFTSSIQVPIGKVAPWGSTGRYSDKVFDELYAKAKTMNPDDPAFNDIMKQLYKHYAEVKPAVEGWGAYTMQVSNGKWWKPMPDGEYIIWGTSFQKMLWEASGMVDKLPIYTPGK